MYKLPTETTLSPQSTKTDHQKIEDLIIPYHHTQDHWFNPSLKFAIIDIITSRQNDPDFPAIQQPPACKKEKQVKKDPTSNWRQYIHSTPVGTPRATSFHWTASRQIQFFSILTPTVDLFSTVANLVAT